jgi:hypothetical protein
LHDGRIGRRGRIAGEAASAGGRDDALKVEKILPGDRHAVE